MGGRRELEADGQSKTQTGKAKQTGLGEEGRNYDDAIHSSVGLKFEAGGREC